MSESYRRIGVLVPAADPVVEADFHRNRPDGFMFYTARLEQSEQSKAATTETLDKLVERTPEAARQIALVDPELIVFACTSGSLYRGYGWDKELAKMITDATGIPATTTSTSVVEACKALGLARVFMITPYPDSTNDREVDFFEANGIEVTEYDSFYCERSKDIGFVKPDEILAMARKHADKIAAAGGLFVSCTALHSFQVVEDLEAEHGCPVVTSNHATLWNTARLVGADTSHIKGGRLYRNGETPEARVA